MSRNRNLEDEYLESLPDEVEMSLFEHLEELRQRIFYALIAVVLSIIGALLLLSRLSRFQLRASSFSSWLQENTFFVSIKVGYSGLLIASPFVLYEIIQFVLPGLTRRERRLIGPVVLGSTVLFVAGLVFAYLLIPAALNFFINYGNVVNNYGQLIAILSLSCCCSVPAAFQIPLSRFYWAFGNRLFQANAFWLALREPGAVVWEQF